MLKPFALTHVNFETSWPAAVVPKLDSVTLILDSAEAAGSAVVRDCETVKGVGGTAVTGGAGAALGFSVVGVVAGAGAVVAVADGSAGAFDGGVKGVSSVPSDGADS